MRTFIPLLFLMLPVGSAAQSGDDLYFLQAEVTLNGESRGRPVIGTRIMEPASMAFHTDEGSDWRVRYLVMHRDGATARVLLDVDRGDRHLAEKVLVLSATESEKVVFEDGGRRLVLALTGKRRRE